MSSLDAGTGPIAARLLSRARREQHPLDMLRHHTTHHPGYIAWSGGKDSTAAAHLALRVNPDLPLVWYDSGLEFPETRPYLNQVADQWGKELHVINAEPDALTVLQSGGGWEHGIDWARLRQYGDGLDAHHALITAPSQRAHTHYGPGEILGLRCEESPGRRALLATHRGHYTRTDGTTVTAPLWQWTSLDVEAYLAAHHIPEHPAYTRLRQLGAPVWAQRVGPVVDGNAAGIGRYTWLKAGWPDLWNQLVAALPRLAEWR